MPGDRRPFVLVPQHFGSLVYDRQNADYLPFDHESTHLLLRLSAEGIEPVLASLDDSEREAVLAFVEFFARRRFFADGLFDAELRNLTPPDDHLVGPLVVHLEVIGACNLSCTHCFAGTLPRNDNPLSVTEMARLFTEMSGMGSMRVSLTGGEPLLRKDIFAILDAALAEGLSPSITTNGVLIDEQIARQFGQRKDVWLTVSLEGPDAATNDPVRGKGTFDSVLAACARLRQHAPFALGFTITSANAHRVAECAELARRIGAHAAVFRPLYPVGVALEHMHLMPTLEQYTQALGDLVDMGGGTGENTPDACGAGQTLCSISVQGDVNPCSFMGSEFETGNIRKRPFGEIWHEGQVMRRMRTDGHRGGCRARSRRLAGTVADDDPWLRQHEQSGCFHPSVNLEVTGSRIALPLIGGA